MNKEKTTRGKLTTWFRSLIKQPEAEVRKDKSPTSSSKIGPPQPSPARRLTLHQVPVDYGLSLEEAVHRSCSGNSWNQETREAGRSVVLKPQLGRVLKDIILINFWQSITLEQAAAYGAETGLGQGIDLFDCLSLGECRPDLALKLELSVMAVISFERLTLNGQVVVPSLQWSESVRRLHLMPYGLAPDKTTCWFGLPLRTNELSPKCWFGFAKPCF